MKDKFLKFYGDHQDTCEAIIIGAGFGIIIAAVATAKLNGTNVKSADIWTRDDGFQMMTINQRNGRTTCLTLNPNT